MSSNKKLVIIASVLIFGQAAAMKRPLEGAITTSSKRPKIEIEDKFRSALHAGEFSQARVHLGTMLERNTKEPIVGEIVSSVLSTREKIELFNQIEKNDQSQGGRFNQPNLIGRKPLEDALKYSDYTIAHALLQRKADPGACGKNGQPILFDIRTPEMGELLIAHGAKLEVDNRGKTLLFKNATPHPEHIAVATWAIAKGIPVDHKDDFGRTAYKAEQKCSGYANKDLKNEQDAFLMARRNSGINPFVLRGFQTGQLRKRQISSLMSSVKHFCTDESSSDDSWSDSNNF